MTPRSHLTIEAPSGRTIEKRWLLCFWLLITFKVLFIASLAFEPIPPEYPPIPYQIGRLLVPLVVVGAIQAAIYNACYKKGRIKVLYFYQAWIILNLLACFAVLCFGTDDYLFRIVALVDSITLAYLIKWNGHLISLSRVAANLQATGTKTPPKKKIDYDEFIIKGRSGTTIRKWWLRTLLAAVVLSLASYWIAPAAVTQKIAAQELGSIMPIIQLIAVLLYGGAYFLFGYRRNGVKVLWIYQFISLVGLVATVYALFTKWLQPVNAFTVAWYAVAFVSCSFSLLWTQRLISLNYAIRKSHSSESQDLALCQGPE